MKKFVLALALSLPLLSLAQRNKTGNLTIFSEDGDKFTLVLNGEKQNEEPQSNIRVEELPQPYYSARIIFEDSKLAAITKNNLMITDADGVFMDVTYKIKKDKNGKVKLNYFSSAEVQQDFIPPSGMYVRHYGAPAGSGNGGVSQTTTTTSTTNGVNANVSVPGISMNVTINDPIESETRTTTTTTTTHSTTVNGGTTTTTSGPTRCTWPMNASDFNAAKNTIQETTFEDSKLSTAKTIASNNCLSTDQVVAICNLFTFEDNKLKFAKYAYKYTTDPKNYFKVVNVFTFDGSKKELNDFIGGDAD